MLYFKGYVIKKVLKRRRNRRVNWKLRTEKQLSYF